MENSFSKFFNNKYLDWQKEIGELRTMTEFAEYLGIPQPMVSAWSNGRYLPGKKYLQTLASKLGTDIYDALGISQSSYLDALPDDIRELIVSAAQEVNDSLQNGEEILDDSEIKKLAIRIFAKHGITFRQI